MWATYRSAFLTSMVIAVALVIGFLLFSRKVENARQACVDRGGRVVIDSDATSIGQYCVMPSGTREPL
jgi:hypothetical protein